MSRAQVLTGLEVLARRRPSWLRQRRTGLLLHQASVTRDLVSARDVLHKLCGRKLVALFGPQHGIAGEKQENMIESPHSEDSRLRVPVHSLYSETRRPTPAMLEGIDTLVIDLQDVGTRVYTFVWTTALALEACAEAGIGVVVLDRPNPLGGTMVEGNMIRPGYESFVGLHSIPMRHGLTIGELASLVNARLAGRGDRSCDLTVIPMKGWRREMRFEETGLPWIPPSPNVPTPETAEVYPGQVLLEGTNLSEGRGTTIPFQVFGAPYIDTAAVRRRFERRKLPGCRLRDQDFEPTFHKWEGRLCRGFQLHVLNGSTFRPYLTTLCLLQDIARLHPDPFEWKQPPYEYVTDRLPIDILTGDPRIRRAIESGESMKRIAEGWPREIRAFRKEAAQHLVYGA